MWAIGWPEALVVATNYSITDRLDQVVLRNSGVGQIRRLTVKLLSPRLPLGGGAGKEAAIRDVKLLEKLSRFCV